MQARVDAKNSLFASEKTNTSVARLMGIPSAPEILQTQETTDGLINVSWAGSSDTGYGDSSPDPLSMYQVDVSLCVTATLCQTTSQRILSTDPDFASRSTLIKAKLLPDTAVTYRLTVLARNVLGWSPSSAPVDQDYK